MHMHISLPSVVYDGLKLGVEVSDNRGRIKVEYYRMLALGCLHV